MQERILLFDVPQLREDLAELRRRDPQFEVFRASDHRLHCRWLSNSLREAARRRKK